MVSACVRSRSWAHSTGYPTGPVWPVVSAGLKMPEQGRPAWGPGWRNMGMDLGSRLHIHWKLGPSYPEAS